MDDLPDIPLPGQPQSTSISPSSSSTSHLPSSRSTTGSNGQTSTSGGLHGAALAGVIVGSLVVVIFIVAAALSILLRSRNHRSNTNEHVKPALDHDVVEQKAVTTPTDTVLTPYQKSYHTGPFPSLRSPVTTTDAATLFMLTSPMESTGHTTTSPSDSSQGANRSTHTIAQQTGALELSNANGPHQSQPNLPSTFPQPENGDNAHLVQVFMELLNTHYESINRPPAYPASHSDQQR